MLIHTHTHTHVKTQKSGVIATASLAVHPQSGMTCSPACHQNSIELIMQQWEHYAVTSKPKYWKASRDNADQTPVPSNNNVALIVLIGHKMSSTSFRWRHLVYACEVGPPDQIVSSIWMWREFVSGSLHLVVACPAWQCMCHCCPVICRIS